MPRFQRYWPWEDMQFLGRWPRLLHYAPSALGQLVVARGPSQSDNPLLSWR